jgi:hypothetical protein
MAKFSQQFLANLGRPQMAESLFGLGSAIGSLPAQAKAKAKQEQFNKIMDLANRAMVTNDPVNLGRARRQLQELGFTEEANRLTQAQMQAEQKQKDQAMQAEMSKYTPGSPEYNAALARQQVGKGMFTEAAATGATAAAQQQAATKAAEDTATRSRLMGAALKKARDDKAIENYSAEAARITSMSAEELKKYLTPKDKESKLFQLSAGMSLVDEKGNVIAERGFKEEAPAKPKYDIKIVGEKGSEKVLSFKDGKLISTTDYTGPKEGETEEAARKRVQAVPELVTNIAKIEALLAKDEIPDGLWAQLTRNIGGTEALDVEAQYQQIKNFLGLEQIAVLKELGGGSTGLGAVSNLELQSLQNSIATLNTIIDEDLQREALTKIKNHMIALRNMAQGQDFSYAINWDTPEYISQGFSSVTKDNKKVVFFTDPVSNDKFVFDQEKQQFVPF